MSKKVIVNGMNIGYLPPTNASEINYDMGGGNYTTVQNAIENITSYPRFGMIMETDIHTLDDFVHLMDNSTTSRGFIGNVNITTDIGIGVTGWVKVFAVGNNPANNGSANVLLYCWFFPIYGNLGDPNYCIITGHTDGNYTVTEQGPFIGFNDKTFGITRGTSHTTSLSGYWAAMLNSSYDSGDTRPTLPSNNEWWHVLSMDWMGVTGLSPTTDWISQLAIATQQNYGVWWRRNKTVGSSSDIDLSNWNRLAEGYWNGSSQVIGFNHGDSSGSQTCDYIFDPNTIYVITLSLGAGNGSSCYCPTVYLAALQQNNATGPLQYTEIAWLHPSSETTHYQITDAQRIETGTNKFRLTAQNSCRWYIYKLLTTLGQIVQ